MDVDFALISRFTRTLRLLELVEIGFAGEEELEERFALETAGLVNAK